MLTITPISNNKNKTFAKASKNNKNLMIQSNPTFTANKLSLYKMLTSKTLSKENKMVYLKNRIGRPFRLLGEAISDICDDLRGANVVINAKQGTEKRSGFLGLLKKS